MIKVIGLVSYDIHVKCPSCGKNLYLNQYPYNDDSTEYNDAEDAIGMMLFGGSEEPARWENISIPIKCCGCKFDFVLNGFDLSSGICKHFKLKGAPLMENIQIKISGTPMDVDYEYGPPRASTRYVSGHPEFVEIVNIRIGGQDIAWHSLFSDGTIDKIEEVILAIRLLEIDHLRAG